MTLALPLGVQAQDDMYFVPTKSNVEKSAAKMGMPRDTYYSGSHRSIDDYNRRPGSLVQPIDSAGNDIIDFDGRVGAYPDSSSVDAPDYQCTRRMSRFDDYDWRESYRAGYRDGIASNWYSSWYWNDPYYWDYPYYYGYSSWYWDSPYYYGWYGPGYYHSWYYRPSYGIIWGGGGYPVPGGARRRFSINSFSGARQNMNTGVSGSRYGSRSSRTYSSSSFSGARSQGTFSGSRNSNTYNGSRSTSTFSGSRNNGSFNGNGGSGSFGGARSSGSFSGGGRSGGSFGGRR